MKMNKNSLRIAIDISPIIYQTGVSTYTYQLVKHLLKVDSSNQYLLYGASLRGLDKLKAMSKPFRLAEQKFFPLPPVLGQILWNQIHLLPIEALIGKCDVFHSSDWYQPKTAAFAVTTVHDLAPIVLPKLTHPRIVAAHTRRLELVKKEVDRVIVPSKAVLNELVKFGVSENKINVIPEAVSEEFSQTPDTEIARVGKKYNIQKPYLFSLGVGGRKNTDKLIAAFKNLGLDMNLVLAGHKPESFKFDSKDIIFTGLVEQKDLPALYSGALALVYVSVYEGFGLPILEAFACGTPVVMSDIAVHKEVAADAALLVDPKSVESIVEGIKSVLKHPKLYKEKGLKRAKDFSWNKAAKMTQEIYNLA